MAKLSSLVDKAQKKQRDRADELVSRIGTPENQAAAAEIQKKWDTGLSKTTQIETELPDIGGSSQGFFDRLGDTVSGGLKGSGAGFTNFGGTLLEGLGNLGSALQDKREQRQAAQDREYLAMYQKQLEEARAKGDAEAERIAQIHVNQAQYRLKNSGNLGDFYDEVNRQAVGNVYKKADELAVSSAQDIERAKQGTGKVGSALVDIGAAGTQLAGDIALGVATGVGAMAPIFVRGFGSGAQQARQGGATYEQQMAYGLGSATVEVLTERLASVGKFTTKAFGTGAIDDIMKGVVKAVEERGKTAAGKAALNRLASIGTGFVGEGMEEAIAGMVDPLLQRATYSDEKIDWQQAAHDAAYQFLIGGVLGGVMGGVGGTDTSSVKTAKPKSEAPSVKPAAETTTSPAAAPEVQQVQAQAEVTKAQNPEAEVLDAATTLFTQQGMNLKTAQTRAEIVGKLVRGEEVSDKDLNRIDPTSNQTKQIFTQLTGVQFPEGKIQIEALRNLYRSAHTVAQAARVTMKEQAIQEIQQMSAEQIVERAKQARQATTPESDAKAAQILAQARGEIAPDGTALLSYKDFAARHKQVFPDASPQETARMYDLYLKENQTISFMGRRMTRQQVRNTLRSAPDGDKLTVAELDAMFDVELEAQSRDGKDATEHSVRNKEANNGRREDSVHSAGLSGQPDQRSRGQGRSISGETGRAEGDGGARGETGTRHSVQGRNQEERQSDARNVRTRGVTLRNSQEVLEVVPETYTPEMQTVSDKFARIGIPVRIIYGGYQIPGTDKYADGVSVLGSETYIQADAVEELAKLGDHEFLHQVVFTDINLKQAAYEALVSRMSDEDFEVALTEYALAYAGTYTHDPSTMLSMIEEMVADAYAGIDRFDLGVVVAHQDAIKDVIDIWVDTYSASYGQEVTLTDDAGNLVVETDDQGHSRFSMSTYDESGRDILTQWMGRAVVNGDLTSQDADDIIKTMDLIYDICKEARESGEYAPFDAWSEAKVVVNEKGEPVFSVVKANGDYAMNLDFSLVCKKRRTLDAVLNELVKRGFVDNLALNERQIVKINDLIRSYGFEVACDLCFVDAKRYRQGKVADDFVKLYNGLVKSLLPKGSGLNAHYFNFGGSTLVENTGNGVHELPDNQLDFTRIDKILATQKPEKGNGSVEYRIAKHLKENPADRKLTTRGDFLSTRGFDTINRENPGVLKLFNAKKGSGGPKSAVSDVQYLNEVLTSKTFTPEKAYAVGGVRIQSFSDYVPRMIFDYVQMIADLAAKKLPAHAYTKEELFVKQFGLTGMKINMSLIPKVVDGGVAPGLDADGNYAWADESFDFEEAKRIQKAKGYSRNCGTIAVGVSDAHIRKLMADPEIRMVIPYHKSGLNPVVAKMNKIDAFVNYTDFQNTRHPNGKNGKKLDKDVAADKKLLNEMPDFNQTMRELGDPRAAAEKYVRWCEENNLLPKFDQFAYKQIDGVFVEKNGKKVVDENYYKLLEDFTVYDKGEYVGQTELKMTFPTDDSAFGSMKNLIKRGLKEDAILEGNRTEKVPEIADEIMKFSVASEESGASSLPETKYSIDSTGQLLTEDQQKYFKDSKVRDDNGNLIRLYHGTEHFGFTVVDTSKSDDGISFFMSDSPAMAESYSGTRMTRSVVNPDTYTGGVDPYTAPLSEVAEEFSYLTDEKVTALDTPDKLRDWAKRKLEWSDREIEKTVKDFGDMLPRWEEELRDTVWGENAEMRIALDALVPTLDAFRAAEQAVTPDEMDAAADALEKAQALSYDIDKKNIYYWMFFPMLRPVSVAQDLKQAATALRAAQNGEVMAARGLSYVFSEQSAREALEREYQYAAESGVGNYELYANLTNPLIIDAGDGYWNSIRVPKELRDSFAEYFKGAHRITGTTRNFAEYAKAKGYDGVMFKNLTDYGPNAYEDDPATVVIAFDSNQVKAADNLNPTKDPDIRYSITPQFEQWYKETYGEDVSTAHLKRRLKTAERRAAEAEHDKKAAELKNTIDSEMDLTAWMIHHTKKMREQKRVSDAKLADARKAKTEAVRTAVAETKEIERAKAEVQHDADRMAERRNAAKRLRTQENAYTNKVTEMKENAKLKRNAAKATLRDSRLAAKKRAAIETEQGLVDTIRKNPAERAAVEKELSLAEKLRVWGRDKYAKFVSQAASIERFGKRQTEGVRADTLVNIVGASLSTIETTFKKGLVDRAGNRIGESMSDVFLCWDEAHKKVNEGQQALLQDFMLHWHNIDRMSIVARAESALETFELNNEWLRDMDQKEFARLVAMTEKEVEKLGKYEAQQQAFEYVRLIRAYNEAQNKPIFADDKGNSVTAETSQRIVDQYLSEQPWLLDKANGIYEWWDLFMREWAVGDTISEAEYERMHTMYPHYVPTYRADKNGVGGANFVGAGGANVSKAVKKAKGSHSEVMNIEDSFSNIVSKIIRLNRVNELYMNIIDTAMLDNDGLFSDMAYFDWDSSWQSGEYGKALLDGELTETVDDAVTAGLEDLGDGEFKLTGWLDGRKYTAFISKDLYKSIGNVTGYLESENEKLFIKAGNMLTGPMKSMITGYNPFFALRNLVRDYSTGCINSISGLAFPKYYARAWKEMAKGTDHWQTFKALGGTHATYYNNNSGFGDVMSQTDGVIGKTKNALGFVNNNTESATRFAEYLATIDRLGDTYENRLKGIKNSAEVTVDFSRKGSLGKGINAWVSYWNPAVQGIDKTIRSLIDSPDGSAIWKQASRTLGRAAMSTVLWEAVQYALLAYLDRDDEWEELDDRTKDTYYCIPLRKSKTFLKVPKNREWGAILGASFNRMLQWAGGREDPFENYIETCLEPNFLPPALLRLDEDGGLTSDIIGVSQALDLQSNKDFAGRTIVPYAYQQGTKKNAYDADTSVFSIALGQLIGKYLSPMQIDYIISDYCGDFGDLFILATAKSSWAGEGNAAEKLLKMVRNPFIADARYSNYDVNSYYELTEELGKVVQDKKNQLGNEKYKETIEYQTQKALDIMYGDQISELNRYVRDLPDGDEKDAVKAQIAQLAGDATEFYEDSMAGKVSNPIRTAEYHDFSETVSKELIRMDAFSGDYKFTPTGNPESKYNDPDDEKNREYILTDEQKAYFKQLYREKYNEIFEDLIQSSKYKKKKDSEKAELLEDARDDVLDATKEEFFEWLDDTGVRSTKKKK